MRLLGHTMGLLCLCAATAFAQDQPAPTPPSIPLTTAPAVDPKEAAAIASYGFGMNTGRSIRDDGVELEIEMFIQGIRDGVAAAKPKYTEEQVRAAITAFRQQMRAQQETHRKEVGEKNKREGEAFLAANKTKEGVKTLASGLQYQVLRAGNGTAPKATDSIKVHYEGTLLDGTVFDSSLRRNEPAVFPVRGVIPGWSEALQLMKVGDKWKVFIPPDLAYGARGASREIGPNALLIFEVELLGIETPPAQRPPRQAQPQEPPEKK